MQVVNREAPLWSNWLMRYEELRVAVLAAHASAAGLSGDDAWKLAEAEADTGPLREQCEKVSKVATKMCWPQLR